MNIVLLSTSQRLVSKTIEDARSKAGTDAAVDVISYSPPRSDLDDLTREVIVVGLRPQPATLPAKVVRKVERTTPGRALRRLLAGGLSRRMWHMTKRDSAARAMLQRSDVVVALDTASIRTAWHVARRNPDKVVVYGAAAAAAPIRSLASE